MPQMTPIAQPLHILRKDAQHLWPEITLHAILLLAFAWIVPLAWDPHEQPMILIQVVPAFLRLLLPILWLVLTARLVQDESLVGDQQFWLTRPYTWPALLASKILFLITFVFLPFLAMQGYLLFHAGLHPIAALPGLLLNLLYLVLICFLPFTVLAAVTSTFPRLALAIIEAILYLIVLALFVAKFNGDQTAPSIAPILFAGLYALCLLAVLLFQYAKRLTLYARIALIATPLILTGLFLALPANSLFHHAYPLGGGGGALHIGFDTSASLPDADEAPLFHSDAHVMVNLPVHVEGEHGNWLESRAVSFTLDSTGGEPIHYVSPWFHGNLSGTALSLWVPEDLVHRLRDNPVRLHVSFAAERFAPDAPTTATVEEHFNVPGGGVCAALPESGRPICNFALKSPSLTFFSGQYAMQPCGVRSAQSTGGVGHSGFPLHSVQLPLLDPVAQAGISLQDERSNPDEPSIAYVCPGTQLTFKQYHSTGNVGAEIDTPPIQLSRYLVHQGQAGVGGVRVHVTHPK